VRLNRSETGGEIVNAGRLAAWLQRVPKSAARLELHHESIAGPVSLAGYSRQDVADTPAPADEVLEVAQEHCDAMRARTKFTIVWLDDEGRTCASQPIRCTPDNDNGDDEFESKLAGAGDAPKESATMDGIVAQLMRHVENRERMLNIALGTNLKLMHDQLKEARQEADSLRLELRVIRERVKESEEADTEDSAESAARAVAYHKVTDAIVTQLVPIVATRLREGMQ
jgi:hypothetical protein